MAYCSLISLLIMNKPNCSTDSFKINNPSISSNDSKVKPSYHSTRDKDLKGKRSEFTEERHQIEERTLLNSKESLSLICESEKIGLKTAQELIRQRETLNNVEVKLESMNDSLKVSQKHLTSMKSIFSGFKSLFSRNSGTESGINYRNPSVESDKHNSLMSTIEEIKNNSPPDSDQNNIAYCSEVTKTIDFKLDERYGNNEHIEDDYRLRSHNMSEEIEKNLNEIDSGVGRLKQLSLGLGNEIDLQNSLIDRITKETERAELNIKQQNSQMRLILRK